MIVLDLLTAFVRLVFVLMFIFGYPEALSKHTSRHAGGTKIRLFFTVALSIAVTTALVKLPTPAYTVGTLSFTLASLLLWRRWDLPIKLSLVLCAYWPATILFTSRILRAQEASRRDRIVREIMET